MKIGSLLTLLVAIILLAGCGSATEASSNACTIGALSHIKGGDGYYGGLTEAAYDDATGALVAKDRYGYEQVVATGDLVQLDTGMKVRVIDEAWDHVVVRVLESPENPALVNSEVWTDCSWLR